MLVGGVNVIWVSIIELAVMVVSAALVIPQIFLMKKQIVENHEESRREKTVELMSMWCNSVKKDTCIAEQVARKLNSEQCNSLYRHSSFRVSEELKKEICKFCPLSADKCAECTLHGEGLEVDGKILTELRWHVITYLNTLETLVLSWHLGIVDKETIEEQFQFLNDPVKGSTLFEFRRTAGGYPIIEKFIDAIKNNASPPKKPL